MHTVDTFDAEIETIRNRIATLEKDRRLYVQKTQGVAHLRTELNALLEKYELSEREYFMVISDRIVDFIKSGEPVPGEAGPRYWSELASYFEEARSRHVKKSGKSRNTKTADAGEQKPVVLKAGKYLNPHTGLYLVKIKRPTREFQEWIDEHGADTVAGWRVD